MKVLVTGSSGFIGKNLLDHLGRIARIEIVTFTSRDSLSSLESKLIDVDFIFHLAGVNRPKNSRLFYVGNQGLTQKIVDLLFKLDKKIPILISSSVQANRDNHYGKSKLGSEKALENYADKMHVPVYVYRLPNVFGKWSRPNYNTVIATWCHNIARDMPIEIMNVDITLDLVYIDDVIDSFVSHLDDRKNKNKLVYPEVSPVYKKRLGHIRDLLIAYKESRVNSSIPPVGRGFERALYSTYLSFLPTDKFSYELKGYEDERGSFYEVLKTHDSGQFSISTTAPGVTRGCHYHHTKNEKFLVLKGEASIRLRQIHGDEVVEYKVSDKKLQIVEMIPGYTHDITNTGGSEMLLLLWANESYDRDNPDTYHEDV